MTKWIWDPTVHQHIPTPDDPADKPRGNFADTQDTFSARDTMSDADNVRAWQAQGLFDPKAGSGREHPIGYVNQQEAKQRGPNLTRGPLAKSLATAERNLSMQVEGSDAYFECVRIRDRVLDAIALAPPETSGIHQVGDPDVGGIPDDDPSAGWQG